MQENSRACKNSSLARQSLCLPDPILTLLTSWFVSVLPKTLGRKNKTKQNLEAACSVPEGEKGKWGERKVERRQHLEPFTHEHVFPPLPLPSGPLTAASLHTGWGPSRRTDVWRSCARYRKGGQAGFPKSSSLLSRAAYCRIVAPGREGDTGCEGLSPGDRQVAPQASQKGGPREDPGLTR